MDLVLPYNLVAINGRSEDLMLCEIIYVGFILTKSTKILTNDIGKNKIFFTARLYWMYFLGILFDNLRELFTLVEFTRVTLYFNLCSNCIRGLTKGSE